MNIQLKFRNTAVVLLLIAFGAGCKKSNDVIIPPTAAHFMNQTFGIYFVTGPGVVYNLPIGVTTVSDKDRTVNISVSSPTGAVQGTHYTIDPVVIHAGKAIDSMTIHGAYNLYTS